MRINPDDRVALRIPLAADDPLRAQKLAVLPTGLARGEGDALWGSPVSYTHLTLPTTPYV